METIFTLPLFILACIQAAITVLHLAPVVGLRVSQTLKALRRSAASRAVLYTIAGALAFLCASSLYELSKGADKISSGNLRGEVMATVDYLRAQVSCALSLSNLLILLLNLALGSERCALDFTQKNLSAMQRQVTGMQAEYDRVTTAAKAGAAGGAEGAGGGSLAAEEAAALKKTVDRLIGEKHLLQMAAEESEKAAKASEARVTAMVSQIKGYDKEFDRMLDENKTLKAKLAQLQAQQGGAQVAADAVPSKKDD